MQRQGDGWIEMQREDGGGSRSAERWKPRRMLPQDVMPKRAPEQPMEREREQLLTPNGPSI